MIQNDPVPPRLLNPRVDHDLETICLKCLEKDPQHRYASAELLAEDLQRYLDGESISARSFNVLDRLARTLDRSQHDADFSTWSGMLLWMAVVIGVEHLVVFLLIQAEQPRWAVGAAPAAVRAAGRAVLGEPAQSAVARDLGGARAVDDLDRLFLRLRVGAWGDVDVVRA